MARNKQAFKLIPVDGTEGKLKPILRLQGMNAMEPLETGQPLRLEVPQEVPEEIPQAGMRPGSPPHEAGALRTHQPGIDLLIGSISSRPDDPKKHRDQAQTRRRRIYWGWLTLAGILLTGAAVWSVGKIRDADAQEDQIHVSTEPALDEETRENPSPNQLVERIESVTRKFFQASKTETLAQHVRHPERVSPLISQYHEERAIRVNPVLRTKILQPLTLDNRANFWMQSVELKNHETRNLIIEITDSGEPKIDWETLVCRQPMKWDAFARERPAGVSLDFRVYLERDHFFSHEFADSSIWNCFRLTALDSDEALFGYAKTTDPVSTELLDLLKQSGENYASVILRVTIPHGSQSRHGLVIEKLMSPRWIYLDPPET